MNLPILRTKADLEDWRNQNRDNEIYFVPTMGGLHKGHKELIRAARLFATSTRKQILISIFVNPLQFAENEDFKEYPRDLLTDSKTASEAGANAIWAPSIEDILPGGEDAHFKVQAPVLLQKYLCGAFRGNHFDGVSTIIVRLLRILKPQRIFLGEKDWQQLVILRQLISDFGIPVKIESIPTIRDEDGLPYSSRNLYLSKNERSQAFHLPRILKMASNDYIASKSIDLNQLRSKLEKHNLKVQYLEIVDWKKLAPIDPNKSKICLLAAAVHCGKTRLIDHTFLMKRKPIIAIDGPAGAGKSTVTKKLAKRLGLIYLDTGAMYRAVTLFVEENNIDISNKKDLLSALNKINIDLKLSEEGNQKVLLNSKDVSIEIRSPKITSKVSLIAANYSIRNKLTNQQQQIGLKGGLVAEGRDVGTAVFPNADLKIYLTASPKVRALRRSQDLKQQGFDVPNLTVLEEQIIERDRLDSTREISPLLKAEDAKELITDGMSIDEVIESLVDMFKNEIPQELWTTNRC